MNPSYGSIPQLLADEGPVDTLSCLAIPDGEAIDPNTLTTRRSEGWNSPSAPLPPSREGAGGWVAAWVGLRIPYQAFILPSVPSFKGGDGSLFVEALKIQHLIPSTASGRGIDIVHIARDLLKSMSFIGESASTIIKSMSSIDKSTSTIIQSGSFINESTSTIIKSTSTINEITSTIEKKPRTMSENTRAFKDSLEGI